MQDSYSNGCNDFAVAQVGFLSSSNDGFLLGPAKPDTKFVACRLHIELRCLQCQKNPVRRNAWEAGGRQSMKNRLRHAMKSV